jgi:hypothetical protein
MTTREQFPAGTRLLCQTNIGGYYEIRVIEWAPKTDAVLVASTFIGADCWMTSRDLSGRIVEVLPPVARTEVPA